jgi:hypothetical protein
LSSIASLNSIRETGTIGGICKIQKTAAVFPEVSDTGVFVIWLDRIETGNNHCVTSFVYGSGFIVEGAFASREMG